MTNIPNKLTVFTSDKRRASSSLATTGPPPLKEPMLIVNPPRLKSLESNDDHDDGEMLPGQMEYRASELTM